MCCSGSCLYVWFSLSLALKSYQKNCFCKSGKFPKKIPESLFFIRFPTFFNQIPDSFKTFKMSKTMPDQSQPKHFFIRDPRVSKGDVIIFYLLRDYLEKISRRRFLHFCLIFEILVDVLCIFIVIFTLLLVDNHYLFFIIEYNIARPIMKVKKLRIRNVISCIGHLYLGCLPSLGMSRDQWCGVCALARAVSMSYSVLLLFSAVVCPYGVVVTLYSILLILALKIQKSRYGGSFSASANRVTTHRLSVISKKSTKSTISSKSRNTVKKFKDSERKKDDFYVASTDEWGDKPRSNTADTQTTFVSSDTQHNDEDTEQEDNKYNETDQMIKEEEHTLETATNGNITTDEAPPIYKQLQALVCKEDENLEYESQELSKCYGEPITEGRSDRISEAVTPSWKNWNPSIYINRFVTETRDKVLFLKRCRAVKTVFLIIGSFTVTYVPFVVGSLVYSLQDDLEKDQCLLHALNTLLYAAIVANSLANPLIYAYGYKEFRIKAKRFKGIFARERKENIC
ncbi:unnamed protein product, partial [Meganyctiphanes norvegica]